MGSLPASTELLVLTCMVHTPERNPRDMRVMVEPGVIKHLHTLYSNLSMHAKPSTEDAGIIYLLSFVCVIHPIILAEMTHLICSQTN